MMIKIANLLKNLKKDDKGFTLIELMVVIAVLGILAALIIPQFANVNDKAKQSNADATASAVASAAAMVYSQDTTKPTDGTLANDIRPYLGNIDDIVSDGYTLHVVGDNITAEKDGFTGTASFK